MGTVTLVVLFSVLGALVLLSVVVPYWMKKSAPGEPLESVPVPPALLNMKKQAEDLLVQFQSGMHDLVSKATGNKVDLPDDPIVAITAFHNLVRTKLLEIVKDAPTNEDVQAAIKSLEQAVIAAITAVIKMNVLPK